VLEVHRITHRDLKPGNVILNARGPVVIDFGIAHPEDATALTATGLVTGSPAWLSPEQANLEPTGPESDIFTLGSLLAFAATGRPPFGEGVSVAVLVAIANKEPDLEGIDPNRTALLRRMLAKDPRQRPTARQVLDRTRMIRAGRLPGPTSAVEPAPAESAPAEPPSDSTLPDGIVPPAAQSTAGTAQTEVRPTPPPEPEPFPEPTQAVAPVPDEALDAPAPAPPGVVAPATQGQASQPGNVPPPGPGPSAPADTGGAGQRTPPTRWALIALVVVAVLVGGWWWLARGGGTPSGEVLPGSSSSATPSTGAAPAAPSADQLTSGDWLLESYRLVNSGTALSVTGTVRNRGDAAGSADLTLWIYLADGTSLGSVGTTVSNVPAGGTVSVTMTGDAQWQGGSKVVLLQAQ
jgi:eukaryotic-like serine/threonine-protein kinase